MDLSFPLASEAALGKYTISVQKDMAKKTFVVKEYGETWTTEVREEQCGQVEKRRGCVHQTFCPGRRTDQGHR